LLDERDANDLSEDAIFATKDLIDHSGFTHWFVVNRPLSDPSQASEDFPMHELLISDIGGVVERLFAVAETLGKDAAADAWRSIVRHVRHELFRFHFTCDIANCLSMAHDLMSMATHDKHPQRDH
jgi:hypothetical protein